MSKESKSASAAEIPTKSTSEPTSKKEKDTTETQTQTQRKSTQSTPTTPLSDDLFPNFTSLTINDNTTENFPELEHSLLHHIDRYQSLQNQLQDTLRSSFIQLSKFKIQQFKSNITYDESEHDANKIISISETRKDAEGRWRIDLDNTDSEFKPLRQVMPLPNFQLRDTTKQFENGLNSIVDIINKRNEVIEVLEKLEKRKKNEKKKLKVQIKKDPTN